jgi:hypothetical protein
MEKVIDISAELIAETKLAFLLFDGAKEAWVPKSQVENNGNGTYTMPEWLAKDKGFI